MSRQPFLPTYGGKPLAIASDFIDQLPTLASIVGKIAINWSGVELHLALILGSMLGVENPAAVAVFLSLRNHRAQRDALLAAAEKSLSASQNEIFSALIAVHKRLDGQRNDVIHCVWGWSESTPDGIIWSSLQDHANMLMFDYHRAASGTLGDFNREEHIAKDIFVWRYDDLEQLNGEIRALAHAAANFHAHLRYAEEPAGSVALRQLNDEPLVRTELERMRNSPGTSREGTGG